MPVIALQVPGSSPVTLSERPVRVPLTACDLFVRLNPTLAASGFGLDFAESMRSTASTEIMYGAGPVVNEQEVASWVRDKAREVLDDSLVGPTEPVSVGDDMAEFLQRIPGVYFLLGASVGNKYPHHNTRFDFDEKAMINGVKVFLSCTLDFLNN